MIESLAEHGVLAMDLVPALMTTHTVANPEYDPAEALRQNEEKAERKKRAETVTPSEDEAESSLAEGNTLETRPPPTESPLTPSTAKHPVFQTTAVVLESSEHPTMEGVTTSLSSADASVTLDIRWTVLCDLFLIIIADSVYDARSRVLLENVAMKLGLGWLDVVKFERRVTEALEIQEGVEKLEQQDVIAGRQRAARKKRYVMMGLATLGMC
jgi:hypothetical protein